METWVFVEDEFPVKIKINACIGFCMQCPLYDKEEKCTDKIKRLLEEDFKTRLENKIKEKENYYE